MLTASLFHGFSNHTALAKTTRTDQYQVVGTFHELLYISDLLHSVSEVVFLYDSAEFKRIFHITHFFVTIFFVVAAKIVQIERNTKKKSIFFFYLLYLASRTATDGSEMHAIHNKSYVKKGEIFGL